MTETGGKKEGRRGRGKGSEKESEKRGGKN